MLGCGGQGLVLGGELGDRAPLVLFGDDGFVGGQFGAGVLQNAVEDASCTRVGVLAGVRFCMVVGVVEDHVGMVGVAAAGHGDVEVLSCGGRLDEDVRGVGGDSLGAVGGDRVPEIDMLGRIPGWQDDRAAEPAAWFADGEGPVAADGRDGPYVAVAYPVASVRGAESSVVAAGDDGVPDSGGGAVVEFDLAVGGEGAVEDQVGAGSGGEGGHVLLGFGD